MGLQKREGKGRTFANILSSDGTIRVGADSNTEGAELRKYELKDGTKGEKWELVFNEISGIITGVEIKSLQFGDMLNIFIADEGGEYTLSTGMNNNFATDIMKKLGSLDLKEKVTFSPYSFEADGKKKKGVTVYQKGEKVADHYYDFEKQEQINGMIVPEKQYTTSREWKRYFEDVTDFLINETNKFIEDSNFSNSPVKKDTNLPHLDAAIKKDMTDDEMVEKLNEKEEIDFKE